MPRTNILIILTLLALGNRQPAIGLAQTGFSPLSVFVVWETPQAI